MTNTSASAAVRKSGMICRLLLKAKATILVTSTKWSKNAEMVRLAQLVRSFFCPPIFLSSSSLLQQLKSVCAAQRASVRARRYLRDPRFHLA